VIKESKDEDSEMEANESFMQARTKSRSGVRTTVPMSRQLKGL